MPLYLKCLSTAIMLSSFTLSSPAAAAAHPSATMRQNFSFSMSRLQAAAPDHQRQLISRTAQQVEVLRGNASLVRMDYDEEIGKVGSYTITAYLEEEFSKIQHCLHINYIVHDVNECSEGYGRCHPSAKCVAGEGQSYECTCDSSHGAQGVAGSGSTWLFDPEASWRDGRKQRPQQILGAGAGVCGGEGSTDRCCQAACRGNDQHAFNNVFISFLLIL